MNTAIKIGVSVLAGIGLGLLWYAYTNEPADYKSKPNPTENRIKNTMGKHYRNQPIAKKGADDRVKKQHRVPLTTPPAKKDRNRWGIGQGTLDFSKDSLEKKQPIPHLEKSSKVSPAVKTAQLTVTNSSTAKKDLTLWGGNESVSVSPPAPTDVEDHRIDQTLTLEEAIHPVGIAVNPVNGLTYVANQLSNTVTVLSSEGAVAKVVQLEPSVFPGQHSPVDVAVNSSEASPHYGRVYVVGSVANTVSVLTLTHDVVSQIPVGGTSRSHRF